MTHDFYAERKSVTGRRKEQVRHLVRSVGVQLESGPRVPFFIEPQPGRFRRNPSLKDVEVSDEQLRTLTVPAAAPGNATNSLFWNGTAPVGGISRNGRAITGEPGAPEPPAMKFSARDVRKK